MVSEELRLQENTVSWKEWCGIRDIFAHQYYNLDHESAWDTMQEDLPELKTAVERILKSNEN